MKTLIALTLLFASISTFAQDYLVKIELDGKPAILNTKTGETTFSNGKSLNNFSTNNANQVVDSHTVVRGDTLYSISKQYGISMAQIKSVNNLKTNMLSVNQALQIGYSASAKINTSNWTVAKGDTLYAISKSTGVSVSTIKTLNNLDDNTIVIGQTLTLK